MEPEKERFVMLKKNGKHNNGCIAVWKSVVGEMDEFETVGKILKGCIWIPYIIVYGRGMSFV